MTRPSRRPALSDEEQRARQLIRELHEAAQDAREAARLLDAAMNRYGGSVSKHYKRVIEAHDADLRSHVGQLKEAIAQGSLDVQAEIAKYLNCRDGDELLNVLLVQLAAILQPIVSDAAGDAVNVMAFRRIVSKEIRTLIEAQKQDQRDYPSLSLRDLLSSPGAGAGTGQFQLVIETRKRRDT